MLNEVVTIVLQQALRLLCIIVTYKLSEKEILTIILVYGSHNDTQTAQLLHLMKCEQFGSHESFCMPLAAMGNLSRNMFLSIRLNAECVFGENWTLHHSAFKRRGNMKEKLSRLCHLIQNSSLIILKCVVKIFSTDNSPCHILYLLKALLCVCLTMARQLYKCWTMFASKTMSGEVAAMSTLN